MSDRARPWRLRRRLGRWFILLAALLAVLGAAVIVSTIEFAVAGNALVYRWQPALDASQRSLADLVNQETGVRGYLLTGQRRSLQPYRQYRRAEAGDLADLRHLISGDAPLRARLGAVETAAQRWQQTVAVPAIVAVQRGARLGTASLDAGQTAFNRIRLVAARLSARIRVRTAQTVAERADLGRVVAIAIGLAVVVIAANGLLLWRGLHVWVLRPIERLGAQTRHVAAGQLRHQIHSDGPVELTELGSDIEYMRAQIVEQLARAEQIQEELRRQGEELERSNADLQQFAYVASHDLSEPLRKVSNFCQLLERQYADQLDDRARQYIFFAVDGAKRMQTLITDLLALSRVGRTTEAFAPVDLGGVLAQVRATLADRIAHSGAHIDVHGELPTVSGDPTLLASLLENLVGNAIKYRRDDVPPAVELSVDRDGDDWLFTVADNGIGIEAKYADRIFAVFQRLHLRDQYGGTGIGLALCRKIVEFHSGRIWLDPVESPTGGATFRFTLPIEGGPDAQPSH